jgi:hypothetical protein
MIGLELFFKKLFGLARVESQAETKRSRFVFFLSQSKLHDDTIRA